jgi:hypothetical protein
VKQIRGMYVMFDSRIGFQVISLSLNFLSHIIYLHLFQVGICGYG